MQDAQTAEECENDTYLEAWNRIPPHEPTDYFYAFLARITRNISLNRCRDRSRLKRQAHICQLTAELEQCIPAPDDTACRLDDLAFCQVLNGFLSTLSIEKRNIFLRHISTKFSAYARRSSDRCSEILDHSGIRRLYARKYTE